MGPDLAATLPRFRLPGYGDVHALLMSLIVRRIRVQSFLNADHADELFATFEPIMRSWLDTGRMHAAETLVHGLDAIPAACRTVRR